MTLIINNLSKNFGENRGVKNVSFTIEKGEILGVFGAGGAGKTTLINIVAGSDDADAGSIFFGGEDVTRAERARYGFKNFAAADDSLWTAFDEKENSDLAGNGEKQPSGSEHFSDAARVFLLDNAFRSIDRAEREKTLIRLKNIVDNKNHAVIFATDDFNEIFLICDRAAFLHNGEIIQTGTPRRIYENPNSAIVAASTGRINLIEAKRLNPNETGSPEFQTLSGNHRIFTDKPEENSSGAAQNATLGIRPEHISISFGASFPEDNLVRARISGVKYLGATTLIELDALGLKLQALVLRLVGLKIGDECMVGLPPNRILVFQD